MSTGEDDRLYISSEGIMRFDAPWEKANGAPPDGVFNPHPRPSQLSWSGATLGKGAAGSLWTATIREGNQLRRALVRIDNPALAVGDVEPDGILGGFSLYALSAETLSNPQSVVEDPQSGKVFVSDTGNNRVLRWASFRTLNSGAPAEAVFGQPDFLTREAGTGPDKMSRPRGSALDSAGNLWISDSGNHRVLRFSNAVWSPAGTPAIVALGQPDLVTNTQRPPSEFTLRSPGPLTLGPGGELWVSEVASQTQKVVKFAQAASADSGAAASAVLGRVDFYDQQSPEMSSSTLFQSVETLHSDSLGRLWVISKAGILFHLYRFDAAASKPNGAPSESTITLDLIKASGIPPASGRSIAAAQPSMFIGPDGKLVLSFNAYFMNEPVAGSGHVLVLADPVGLPAVVDLPSQAESVSRLPEWNPSIYGTGFLGLAPPADNSIWIPSGISSVQRYALPPYEAAAPEQQITIDLVETGGADVLAVRFGSYPGRDYQLFRSIKLTEWLPGQKLSATGATSVFVEAPVAGNGFFKVVLLP